ncbi:MAG: hypothetical protein QOC92_2370 [Acidimicrobiaceae bacterium]
MTSETIGRFARRIGNLRPTLFEHRPAARDVTGEIDLPSCAEFRDALNEAVESGARDIKVDFKHVTFMGSTGIRELVRALQAAERITLLSPSSIVRRVVETAHVGKGLVIVD